MGKILGYMNMKNKKLFVGILIILLVFGLLFSGKLGQFYPDYPPGTNRETATGEPVKLSCPCGAGIYNAIEFETEYDAESIFLFKVIASGHMVEWDKHPYNNPIDKFYIDGKDIGSYTESWNAETGERTYKFKNIPFNLSAGKHYFQIGINDYSSHVIWFNMKRVEIVYYPVSAEPEIKYIEVEPEIKYIEVKCPDKPCPSGYDCMEETGLCIKTVYIENDCSKLICRWWNPFSWAACFR